MTKIYIVNEERQTACSLDWILQVGGALQHGALCAQEYGIVVVKDET